jgi:hypothetical protein
MEHDTQATDLVTLDKEAVPLGLVDVVCGVEVAPVYT